jgi:hypothetical protein
MLYPETLRHGAAMNDLLFFIITGAFLGVSLLYVLFCERL